MCFVVELVQIYRPLLKSHMDCCCTTALSIEVHLREHVQYFLDVPLIDTRWAKLIWL